MKPELVIFVAFVYLTQLSSYVYLTQFSFINVGVMPRSEEARASKQSAEGSSIEGGTMEGVRPKRASAQKVTDYRRFGDSGVAKLDTTMDVIKEAFSPQEHRKDTVVTVRSVSGAEFSDVSPGLEQFTGDKYLHAPSAELSGEDEDIAEIDALKQKLAQVEAEKRRLRLRQEKASLKAQLERSTQEVEHLRKEGNLDSARNLFTGYSNSVNTSSRHKRSKPGSARDISDNLGSLSSKLESLTINDLRKDHGLRKKVLSHMKQVGLLDADSSSESSDDSEVEDKLHRKYGFDSGSSSGSSGHSKIRKKSKKKSKSGINTKASDKVKFPQKWSHSFLQYEHVNKSVSFENLDLKLFVAGELEIISDESLSKEERKGRVALLKKNVYYCNTYSFEGLKSFYAAWLRQIELGIKHWRDDSQCIEQAILSKHVLRFDSSSKRPVKPMANPVGEVRKEAEVERLWFCALFNRNRCAKSGDHFDVVRGRMRHCLHICASCWQKDQKKLKHAECSKECPHAVQ